MAGEHKKSGKRAWIIALCAAAALAGVIGAYRLGRSAGRGGDIGEETAKSIALSHAAVAESALSSYEIVRDEAGSVYEVEFSADSCAYAYVVNAVTGSIVKFSRKAGDAAAPLPAEPEAPAPADSRVDEARAWEIAYGHAGVAMEEVSPFPAKLDYENGALVYELEFLSGGYGYEYEISAADGSIVKFEKEPDDRSARMSAAPVPGTSVSAESSAPQSGGAKSDIGEARAKEIALSHAGVTADSVSNYKWELELNGGVSVYELEFLSGGYGYEYEISAADGSVVKFEKEAVQSAQGTLTADAVSYIGEARAKEIAYGHACLTADAVTHCSVELDHHGSSRHGGHGSHHGTGCCAYEIDFKSGGHGYEYKIDAVTGEILEFEWEADH